MELRGGLRTGRGDRGPERKAATVLETTCDVAPAIPDPRSACDPGQNPFLEQQGKNRPPYRAAQDRSVSFW